MASPDLAAGEGQPPLAVGPAAQRGAAGQQVEPGDGFFLRDFTVPEVVGRQPALGHSGPAPERHHRQQVVQNPAGARLQEGHTHTCFYRPGNAHTELLEMIILTINRVIK